MNFIDLLFEEDGIKISPFSLFAIGKKKLFDKINKVKPSPRNIKKIAGTIKEKADIEKEKINAMTKGESDIGDEGALYNLTDEQLDVMAYIYKKYGYKIYNEIKKFRKNVLAAYEVLKRDVKKNSRVTAKEVYGLTKEEFLAAYESGRKKIENRGMKYVDNSQELREKIKKYDQAIEQIKEMKERFEKTGEYDAQILDKLFNKIGAGLNNFGKKIEETSTKTFSVKKMNKIFKDFNDGVAKVNKAFSEVDREKLEREKASVNSNFSLSPGEKRRKIESLEKAYNDAKMSAIKNAAAQFKSSKSTEDIVRSLFQDEEFVRALGPWLLQEAAKKELKNSAEKSGNKSFYYYFYMKIIEELIKKKNLFKMEKVEELKDLDKDLEFNENEAKIFKLKAGAPRYSSNINDYKQKIKIEDYPDEAYIPVKRSKELSKAMEKVEREIKKFERKLLEVLDKEDVELLKKYRLINNLIKIKELENPETLFKSSEEIERTFKTISKKESEMEYNIERKEKDSYYMKAIRDELEKAKRFKELKDENKFRSQKTKIRNLIREFRRVDIKANKKLARFKDDFESLNFSVLTSGSDN